MTKEIGLTKGKVAQVDDGDYEMLMALGKKWHVSDGYAVNLHLGRLHRFLLGAPDGVMVDHRNGDTLDNRRDNLRLCTNSQNQANRQRSRGVSPFKGVCWQKRTNGTGSWKAQLVIEGNVVYLGVFGTDLEAAAAYNAAALSHFGEFAHLNDLSLPASETVSHERRQTRKASPSGFKGVTYDVARNKWMAQLTYKGVSYLKKRFATAESAALAYDAAARTAYGPTATTNF